VLQKQRVVADRGAVGLAQQPVPQLALEHDLGMRAQLGPQALENTTGPAEAEAAAAKLALDCQRVGRQIVPIRKRRLQPGEECLGARRVRLVPADFDQCALAQLIGEERGAVGGNPEETAPCLPLPLGQIIGQPGEYVPQFLAQITLELENDRAEQRVGAAMHLGQPHLVVDFVVSDAEPVTEDFGQMCADGLVARTGRKVRHDLGKMLLSPGADHEFEDLPAPPPDQGLSSCRPMRYKIWYGSASISPSARPLRRPQLGGRAPAAGFYRAHTRRADRHSHSRPTG
jgi:hypothetical protein